MPVYIHLANVFIKKSAIILNYKGGLATFRKDFSIGRENFNQEDGELLAIAQMNVDEFDLNPLISKGLHFDKDLNFSKDFTIRPRYGTYLWKTDWIADNNIFAWHIGAENEQIAKAIAIGNIPMCDITEMFERGENPFATII